MTARRTKAGRAPTTSDPIEIAMAAEAHDTAADSPARRLLVKQERLVGWQIASERAGVALKVLTGLAGLAAAGALGLMVWQASQAKGLLVEPFSVPPDMAARGLTGEVVASHVLDQLARLQLESNSYRRASAYANDWGKDIKVAIPTTGVNLGELQAALRHWLGHETHISGEVYRSAAGVAIAARSPGAAAFVVEGPEADLDGLSARLAKEIYEATQPYRYGRWLTTHGDVDGGVAVFRQMASEGSNRTDQSWGYRQWAWSMARKGDPQEAVRLAREALSLSPGMGAAWQVVQRNEYLLGHGEASLVACDRIFRYLPKDPEIEPWARNARWDAGRCAETKADYLVALREYQADLRSPRQVANTGAQLTAAMTKTLVSLHEVEAAERYRADKAISKEWIGEEAHAIRAQWSVVIGREDWAGLVALAPEVERIGAFGATPRARVSSPEWLDLIYAKAMLGDQPGAAAMAAQTPADCDRCLTLRGQLAALAGDWSAADSWFAAAAKAAPSFPQPLVEWGRMRLTKGDLPGALDRFQQASKRVPGWADPLKLQADVLVRQGERAKALVLYAEAAKRAPNWGGLDLAWGRALAAQGDKAGAAAKYARAATLDLTAAERAELVRIQGSAP